MIGRLGGRHPSRKRLERWLNASDASPEVTRHLDTCERCAQRIEELAAESTDDDEGFIGQVGVVLRQVYSAPEGIAERVMTSIESRERADREMNLLFGMFSIPRETAELMLPEEPLPPTRAPHSPRKDQP